MNEPMTEASASQMLRRELHPKASLPPPADQAPLHTLDFRSSDETLDRYCEVITVAGWKLDNYRKNPVVQNAHSYCSLADTIGKSLITEIRSNSLSPTLSHPMGEGLRVRVTESSYLFQRIQFAVDENPMAKLAYGLYKGGFLSAVSVGFIPIRWENGSAEAGYRRKYLEQELLEVSAVSIPANPNALTLALKAGAIGKSDVKELLDLLGHFLADENALTRPLTPSLSHPMGEGVRRTGEGSDDKARWLRLAAQVKEIRAALRRS